MAQLIFFLRFYLFILQRETQREREHKQGEREREKQASHRAGSLMWGLDPRTLGSRPELKAAA